MANLNRGEHDIVVDDVKYTLVLTLEDMENLESGLGIGSFDLLQRLMNMTAFASHIRAVLTRGFTKGKPRLALKDVPALINRISYNDRHTAALVLVGGALNQRTDQQPPSTEDVTTAEEGEPSNDPLSLMEGSLTGDN